MADIYSTYQEYAKFLKKKCEHEDHEHCGCKTEKCGCCDPGLVAVEDNAGTHIGCLTPNDAKIFMSTTFKCPDGYIKVVDSVTGNFIGCLTPDEYVIYKSV